MMKKRSNGYGKMSESSTTSTTSMPRIEEEEVEWEMRPGGMLVQKRSDNVKDLPPVPNVRLRVAYGALRYEISVNSSATFGKISSPDLSLSIFFFFYRYCFVFGCRESRRKEMKRVKT